MGLSGFRPARAIGSGRLTARPKARGLHPHPINVIVYNSPRLSAGLPQQREWPSIFPGGFPLRCLQGLSTGAWLPGMPRDSRYTRGPGSAFLSYLRSLPVRRPAPPVDSDRTVFAAACEEWRVNYRLKLSLRPENDTQFILSKMLCLWVVLRMQSRRSEPS